ncbi:MAG: hypothetical protein WBM50_19410 [Acidimicrobiales bacterium]
MPVQPTCGPATLADKLNSYAFGIPHLEAASHILTRSLQGRLLDTLQLAWEDDEAAEIDWPATLAGAGYLSGGERRLLALAASLGSGHPVDLVDALTGLDTWNAQVVVDAIAHAAGVHFAGYGR